MLDVNADLQLQCQTVKASNVLSLTGEHQKNDFRNLKWCVKDENPAQMLTHSTGVQDKSQHHSTATNYKMVSISDTHWHELYFFNLPLLNFSFYFYAQEAQKQGKLL
jgi:hypothetical protein